MSTEWTQMTWGDLATLEYGKALRDYRDSEGEVPVFGTNGQIGWHTIPLYNEPSVVIGRKGAYRGVHFADRPFSVIDTAFYLKPKIAYDPRWAYFKLLTVDINALDSGSAIPSTSRDAVYVIPVSVPSIGEQREIVAILGAFDDKASQCARLAKTLDEFARAVFADTFHVNRSPDWRNGTIGDLCAAQYGYTTSASIEPVGPKFLRITDIVKQPWVDWNAVPHCEIDSSSISKYRLATGDIVVARTGATTGESAWIDSPPEAIFASYLVRLKTEREADSLFLYYYLNSPSFFAFRDGAMGGSAQPNMSASLIASAPLALPPSDARAEFSAEVSSLRERITKCVTEQALLRAMRDTMLPKLMSGELRVGEAEKIAEAAL